MHIFKSKLTLLFSFFCANTLIGANIVFDLHGVLINVSHTTCIRQLPLTTTLQYLALDAPSFKEIKKDIFTFLEQLDDLQPTVDTYDPSGSVVPTILTNNLTNVRSCVDVCARAEQFCLTHENYFRSPAHRSFMLNLTYALFTPSLLVHSISWFNDMVDLAIEYKRLGHKVFILSNLNNELFLALKAQYPFHIAFFDGVIISGAIGLAKPDHAIYKYLLNTYHLKPEETLFIDDQAINCITAELCGITSIVCPQKRSWMNLWAKQPDSEQTRRLINLTLYRQAQLFS